MPSSKRNSLGSYLTIRLTHEELQEVRRYCEKNFIRMTQLGRMAIVKMLDERKKLKRRANGTNKTHAP